MARIPIRRWLVESESAADFEDRLAEDEPAQAALIRAVEIVDCLRVIALSSNSPIVQPDETKPLGVVLSCIDSQDAKLDQAATDHVVQIQSMSSDRHRIARWNRIAVLSMALVGGLLIAWTLFAMRSESNSRLTQNESSNPADHENADPELIVGWVESVDMLAELVQANSTPGMNGPSLESDDSLAWIDGSLSDATQDGIHQGDVSQGDVSQGDVIDEELDWIVLALEDFDFEDDPVGGANEKERIQ